MKNALLTTDFQFPGQTNFYRGKVRDVYTIEDKFLVMIASDRISAFDVVLPRAIPYKGQVLNQIAGFFLDATADLVPNWKLDSPDPVVTIGRLCKPFAVEMIVRGYLSGSAWRTYKKGVREICGVAVPDGLCEHQRLPEPIITPTTKASEGHDEDISREEIISKGIVSKTDYLQLENYALALFERGTEMAAKQGLILVDTKYEFGKADDQILLIDEIHTPDSSRYFMADEYQKRFETGAAQMQLSKEFVREWLMENGFQGQAGQQVPEMTDDFVEKVSLRYIELFERVTGQKFVPADNAHLNKRIETAVAGFLKNHH
ncbi:MAG: phosphoribosylaminoimidazolesuccinocarboxamide synthase [Bacteroidales bacterium]|jgi:phosphoribosylaminoimidazole-succinocarboxamide synthase|nr:phosphoribosylaminoimidazolesuccinocarboxamide synthase [Bacteroidales bacterium]HOI32535.1 phosphoribosylaminoimidazolesuccinocarboxamide synthase [Bacteroidales bacterium]